MNFDIPASAHALTLIVADYWASLCKDDGRLPGRQDFDPVDLPLSVWPYLILSDVLTDPFDIRYRFVGTEVVSLYGKDNTGLKLSERTPRRDPELTVAAYRAAIEEKTPQFGQTPVYDKNRGYNMLIERTHFPMAKDGVTVDMILASFVKIVRYEED